MTPDPFETLSAFMDGEEPDATALAEALTAPGAREALLDFVLLRVELAHDSDGPPASLREAVERELRHASAPRRRLVIIGAAAALLAVVAVSVLRHERPGASSEVTPPPAQREFHFTEGVDWFRR